MTQKTKVLISFSLLMLTGCYSTQSQNYIVEKSNENSQKLNISTQQDVCNSENKNKKVISRKDEDRCFNQEVLYSELSASYKNKQKLPDCNNKTHPYTWDQCFGKVIGFFYEFEGEFINGKREGFGTLKDNVREYSGEWKNDLPEGIGIFKAHHVSEYGAVKVKGKWEEGFLKTVYLQNFDKTHQLNNVIDQGQFKFTNEILQKTLNFSLYAKYQNIQCFGDDPSIWSYCSKEIYFTNGDKYSGAWKDGKFHGTGTYTYKDSSYYYGEWSLGEKDGSGSFYDTPTKKSVNEYWDYGKKISYEQYKEKLVRNVPKYEITDIRQKRKTFELKIDSTKIQIDGGFLIKILNAKDLIALKINDEDQVLSNSKLLEVKKFAKAGQETVFTIVATDINGNTDTKTITVNRPVVESQAKFTTLNPAQVKKQPERDAVAIIIGIADYKNLPRADFANDDASVFYDYAVRALGIKPENIRLMVDVNADDVAIYQAFKTWLPSRVRSTTDVYVYYSGHGLPAEDGQGLYLLPQRAHRDLIEKTAISQREINGFIQAAKPKSVTIFLDSCYSGLARTGETLLASARPVALKADKKIFPDEFTVITASQADQISSSSPDLKHGIFSYYLMRGMEGDADANRDGKITVGEMHSYLSEQVTRQAGMMNRRQDPQLVGDANRVLVEK